MANPGAAVLGIAFILGLLAFLWGLAIVGLALFVRRARPPSVVDHADRPTAERLGC